MIGLWTSSTEDGRNQAGSRRATHSRAPPQLVGRVFRGSAAVRSGYLTRHQLHSSAWRRLYPDVYARATLPLNHQVRAFAATRMLLPSAVACGRTAAVLCGVELAGPEDPVECVVPASCRGGAVPGVRVTRRALPDDRIVTRRGIRTTDALHTALDLAAIRPMDDAVVALDQFLGPGLVFLDEVREAARTVAGRHCRQVRRATDLADGLAGSPQETRLRLLLHRSDLPRPIAQYSVRIGDQFLARVDFAWPEQRLALEYEGVWHGEHQQVARDRRRLNGLTRAGWRVIFVTASDLRDPARLVARIVEALASPRSA